MDVQLLKRLSLPSLNFHGTWVQQPKNQECQPLRAGGAGGLSSSRESKLIRLPPFCFMWALSGPEGVHLLGRTTCPSTFSHVSAHLFWNTATHVARNVPTSWLGVTHDWPSHCSFFRCQQCSCGLWHGFLIHWATPARAWHGFLKAPSSHSFQSSLMLCGKVRGLLFLCFPLFDPNATFSCAAKLCKNFSK